MRNANLHSSLRGWLLLAVGLLYFTSTLSAADYYWVNGSGEWGETTTVPFGGGNITYMTHWAKIASPASPLDYHSVVPGTADDVKFDGQSNVAVTAGNNTIAKCHDFNCSGAFGSLDISGGAGERLEIYGAAVLLSGMTVNIEVRFEAIMGGGGIISSNTVHFGGNVYFEGSGGGWSLSDALWVNGTIYHDAGHLLTNGNAVTVGGSFYGDYYLGNAAELTLGASTVTINGDHGFFTYLPVNFDAGSSTIVNNAGGWVYGRYDATTTTDFYNVTFNTVTTSGLAYGSILGTLTFHELGTIHSYYPASPGLVPVLNNVVFEKDGYIYNANDYHNLTLAAGHTYTFDHYYNYGYNGFDQTITSGGNITIAGGGSGCNSFTTIKTWQYGTPVEFINNSGANITLGNVVLQDIHATPANSMIANNSIDLGNNTGWTINTTPIEQRFWVGGDGDWSDQSHWSTSSGGSGGACIPTPNDDVFFDANSGFTGAGGGVTLDQNAFCRNMDWSAVTGNPLFQGYPYEMVIYGSLAFAPLGNMTFATSYVPLVRFRGTSNTPPHTVTSAGQTWNYYMIFEHTGTYELADDIIGLPTIEHHDGKLRTMGHDVNCWTFNGNWNGILGTLCTKNAELWLGDPIGGGSSLVTLGFTPNPSNYGFNFKSEYPVGKMHAMNSEVKVKSYGDVGSSQSGYVQDFWKVTFEDISPIGYGQLVTSNILDKVSFSGEGAAYLRAYSVPSVNINEAEILVDAEGISGDNLYGNLTLAGGRYYRFNSGYTHAISATGNLNVVNADCEGMAYLQTYYPTDVAYLKKDGTGTLNLDRVILDNIYPDPTPGPTYSATNSIALQPAVATAWNVSNPSSRDLFWVGGSGNWNDSNHWSATSGGANGECPPTPLDNVKFDAASGLASSSDAVTLGQRWSFCKDMTWLAGTNGAKLEEGFPNPDWQKAGSHLSVFGNLTFSNDMVNDFDGLVWMRTHGGAATSITSAGNHFKGNLQFWDPDGDFSLNDELNVDITCQHQFGKLHSNDQDITLRLGWYNEGYPSAELWLGNSTMHILSSHPTVGHGYGYFYYVPGKFHSGMSSIIFEDNNRGALYANSSPETFFNVRFRAANSFFWGGNIANKLVFEKTGGTQTDFANSYIHDVEYWGDHTIYHDWDIHKLHLFPGNYYDIYRASTISIVPDIDNPAVEGKFDSEGTPGNYINLRSTNPDIPAIIHMDDIDGDNICAKYLFLAGMTHTGTEDIYVPAPGGDIYNNTGWLFFACNPCPATIPVLAASSVTAVCTPGNAVLVLDGLLADESALWYDNLADCLAETNPVYFGGNNFQPPLTGTNSATYYARTHSDGGLCNSTVYLTVPITGTPTPTTAISGNLDLCGQPSTTLTATGGGTYEWSNGETTDATTVSPTATTTYTVTVTGSGGCTATAAATVIVDNQPPMLACPSDLTILTGSDGPGDCAALLLFMLPTATDNCGSATVVSSIAIGSVLPLGTTTIVLTATDGTGNTATCTFTATVLDDESPLVQCPDDMDIATCLAVTGIDPVIYVDNCTSLTINDISYTIMGATTATGTGSASGTLFEPGLSTVTYTATDWSGNMGTCSFSLDVTGSNPAVNVVTNNPYCLYGDLTMTENGGAAVSWAWSGPFGFTSDLQSPVIHTAGPEWSNETFGVTITDANGCTNSQTFGYSDFIPQTSINTPANQSLCNGATTAPVNFTGGFTGTTYDWSMSTDIGLTPNFGTGNIPAFSAVNTTNAPIVATVTVIPLYYGCGGNAVTFTITVNPTPAVAVSSNSPICDGADLHFTESGGSASGWSWEGPNGWASAVQNPSLPDATPAASGNYTVTVTDANGCTNSQTVAVTVNPGIEIDPVADITVCHGQPTGDIVFGPTGNLFDWTIDNVAIGAGAGAMGVPQIPSFIAINPSSLAPTVATVSVLPAAGSCSGLPETFTITVNPIPTINPVPNITVCAGELVNVPFGGVVGGTTFNWSYTTVPAGKDIGLPSSGMGDLNFTALNTTSANVVATFTVMPMFGGCPCTNLTFTITVKPTPQIMTTLTDKTFCSTGKSVLAQTLTANMPGTVITWVNTSSPTVILPASGGNVIPAYTPTNTGTAPLVATIVVTATKNGCSSSKSFTITVNPVPTLAAVPNQTACHGELKTITLTSNLPSPPTSFIWTSSNATTGLTAGTFAAPDRTFTALNTGTANKITNVTVKGTANGCNGPAISFSLTVKPTPNVAQPVNREKCHGEMSGNITFSTAPAMLGVTYSWSVAPSATALAIGMPAASGTGAIPSFSVVNSGIAPVTVTVTVAATKNGCAGPARTFTIKAKPVPVLDAMPAPTVCAGATVSIPLSSPVAGTTFTWQNTNPAIGLSAGPVLGSIPNFTATNGSTAQITGIITVHPIAYGCDGPIATTLVNVNPTATVNQPGDQTVESGDAVEVIFTGTPSSTVYNWTQVSGPDIGLGTVPVSGTGNLNFTADNPATVDIIGTFEVTPVSSGGCTGATKTFSITVQPMMPLPPPPTADREAGTDPCDAANSTEPGAALGFLLHQNYPNPFWEETTVSFCLPKEMPATLTVWDMAGRLLYCDSRDFPAGENAILLNANDLGATRALVCRLETPLGTAVRQMLRVQ